MMRHTSWRLCTIILSSLAMLAGCTAVDLNAPMPVVDTGIDSTAWAAIPAGAFLKGQNDEVTELGYNYEIMVTDVTVTQYLDYLEAALGDGTLKVDGEQVVGYYPGDVFHGVKHEVEIKPADYIFVPLNDPASRFKFDGQAFQAQAGYENHPITNVSWFGAWGYCRYYNNRLPTELEWEKAARGVADNRPFPWGDTICGANANYYVSRDPLENMRSYGSRTTPVGFYNGQQYLGFQTVDSASPYGLYDMAGNVWQWTGNVYDGMSVRFLRGGSKETYDMDLRVWVTNNATPTYYGPDVGFRCVKGGD